MKNIRIFLFENFRFLVVKFSFYLNRLVFVMHVHVHFEPTQVAYAIFLLLLLLLLLEELDYIYFDTVYTKITNY